MKIMPGRQGESSNFMTFYNSEDQNQPWDIQVCCSTSAYQIFKYSQKYIMHKTEGLTSCFSAEGEKA